MTEYGRMSSSEYATWLAAGGNLSKASLASQAISTRDLTEVAAQLRTQAELGPGQPMAPAHQETLEPRRFDYQSGRNVVSRPRQYDPLTPAALRALCSTYDVARIAIEARKDEVRGWDHDVRVRPLAGLTRDEQKARAASFGPEVTRVRGFLESPDQEHDFGSWLMMYLEDLFVLDAPTIFLRPTLGGELYAAEVIDGATISVMVDAYGRLPRLATTDRPKPHIHDWQPLGDGQVCTVCHWPSAYQQIVHGIPFAAFAAYELLYTPYHPSTTSPYGTPPIYWVLMAVNRALRRQSLDLANFTEGTIPAAIYRLPEGWSAPQVQELQDLFDALLAGDDRGRSKFRFLPGGTGAGLDRINPEPTNEVEKWLMHVTAAAFGTSAYELGFEPDSGLGGAGFGDASRGSAERRGARPMASHLAKVINRVIARLGRAEFEHIWRGIGQTADQLKEAQRDEIQWRAGVYGTDEWREDAGRDPIGLEPSVFDPKLGVVVVKDLLAAGAATAGASAALAQETLDPNGESVMAAEAAGAQAATSGVPSAAPDETTVGRAVGTPAVALGKASAAGDLAAWERKAVRALKTGRDGARFSSDAIEPATAELLRERLRKASTAAEVRAAFDAVLEVLR